MPLEYQNTQGVVYLKIKCKQNKILGTLGWTPKLNTGE
jgi:hypothetical protein